MKLKFFIIMLSVLIFSGYLSILLSSSFSSSEEPQKDNQNSSAIIERHEIPDDEYIPTAREGQQRSSAFRSTHNLGFTVQVNIDSFGQNILGDAANEPSIAVSPTDPNKIVIGWRQFDTINSNFRQAGYSYTSDGGQSWTFPGVIEPGVFRSDPVLDFDSQGTFYYNSLTSQSSNFWCDVFKSSDGGATWDSGTFAQGGDKQWMVIDRTGGIGEGNIYAYWSYSYSICSPGFFTRSVDRGDSYESCITIPGLPYWGTLAVARNGDLYVGGVSGNGFVVAKSTNAKDSSQVVAWDFATTVDLDGRRNSGVGPNPGGLLGQTWIATDTTTGITSDNVYLLCSVNRSSTTDTLDVMFSRSTDGGLTWSTAVRINDDTTDSAWQWFGTMSVAPNGRIDVVWLDTRDNPGTYLSSLYYSYSMDGGFSWSQNERLSAAFNPHIGWPQQNKMGDYFDMISNDDGAHLAWANTFNGEQDVYYSFIADPLAINDQAVEYRSPGGFMLSQNYPNPFNPSTKIKYTLPKSEKVKIEIFNLLGQKIETLVNKQIPAGSHEVEFNAKNLPSGVYLYRIEAGDPSAGSGYKFQQVRKMILLK